MGMESQPNLDPALPPSGLCNAVILAKPYSSFISACRDLSRLRLGESAYQSVAHADRVLRRDSHSTMDRQLPHFQQNALGETQRDDSVGAYTARSLS